jgi:hypothetical protein
MLFEKGTMADFNFVRFYFSLSQGCLNVHETFCTSAFLPAHEKAGRRELRL